MRQFILFIFVNLLIGFQLSGQNLIINGNFEQQEGDFASSWQRTAGTPDYINLETSSEVRTLGIRDFPIPGSNNLGFMGIVIGYRSSEVFHQSFDAKLEKDAWYELSCIVLAGNYCRTGFEVVTIAVSPMQLEISDPPEDYKVKCHKLSTETNKIPHGKWTSLKTTFKAKGYEKYISIGNFNLENAQFTMSAREMIEMGSGTSCNYIYFDEFELKKIPNPEPKKIVLRELLFDLGKANLKAASETFLDSIYHQFKSYEKALIIEGHTDNIGTVDENQILSEDRANSVRRYFIRKGYNAELITAKGLGEKVPIRSNETEQGRRENRRVEIIFQN